MRMPSRWGVASCRAGAEVAQRRQDEGRSEGRAEQEGEEEEEQGRR